MNLSIERKLWAQGYKLIAGVDEAGRGPLAGPVVAAAVILQPGMKNVASRCHIGTDIEYIISEINDSKKLTEKKREELFEEIKKNAICEGVGISTHEEIDRINILQASLLAMRRAIENLKRKPDYIIVDGLYVPFKSGDIPQQAIIKGDSSVCSIAAASIIAKVTRDRLMREFALQYPRYRFEKHKGYPTREHTNIIKKIGPCPIHRCSFAPVAKLVIPVKLVPAEPALAGSKQG